MGCAWNDPPSFRRGGFLFSFRIPKTKAGADDENDTAKEESEMWYSVRSSICDILAVLVYVNSSLINKAGKNEESFGDDLPRSRFRSMLVLYERDC